MTLAITFLAPAPPPHRSIFVRRPPTSQPRAKNTPTATASTGGNIGKSLPSPSEQRDGTPSTAALRSPAVYALFEQQKATPLFQPSLVSNPGLKAYLSSLTALPATESPSQFARSHTLTASGASTEVTRARIAAAETVALRSRAAVANAKRMLLLQDRELLVPNRGRLGDGGAANACWRDMNALTRVAGYACLAPEGVCVEGARVMCDVYHRLDLDVGMSLATLQAARETVLRDVPAVAKEFGVSDGSAVALVVDEAFNTVRDVIQSTP